jgi:predicted small lipoprotein YifL
MTVLLRFMLLVVLSLSAACGKKGPLIPPDGFAPAPVSALQVAQQGESFRISWLAPEQDLREQGTSALAGFRLYRREIRSPDDECPTCGADDLLIRTVDLEYLQDVVRVGNLFVVVDGGVKSGKSYQYQVTAFEKSGAENRDSGRVKRKKVGPPPAPAVLTAEAPGGLMLEWATVQAPAGILSGYNVYRLRPAERYAFHPITPAPVKETRFEDLRMEPDTVYRYLVRTVALVDGETVESDPSPQVEGKFVLP